MIVVRDGRRSSHCGLRSGGAQGSSRKGADPLPDTAGCCSGNLPA